MKSYMRREYKLPELFDMYMGKTPDRNNLEYWENGTHPWISIADMTSNGKLITNTKEYITDKAIRETGIKPINYNTVIMSFKLSVGKVSKVATMECPAYSNEAIMAFEIPPVPVGSPMILNDYAYYLLQSLDFTNAGNKAVMGKTLNKAIFQNTAVKIHVDLDVQSEIITVLDKVTDLIDKRKEQLLNLDEFVKARFVEMFGDLERTTTIARYISELRGGKSLAGTEPCKNKVLKTGAATFGWFDPEQYKYLPADYEPLPEHKVETGDVIISRMNTPELVGACSYVFDAPDDMYYPDRLWKAVLKENTNPIFLWQLLWDRDIRKAIKESSGGTSGTMHNISKANLLTIKCMDAPIELQNEYAEFVKQTDKSKLEVQKSLEKLELLKKALMQKYFG